MEAKIIPSRESDQIRFKGIIPVQFKVKTYGKGQMILDLNFTEVEKIIGYEISQYQVSFHFKIKTLKGHRYFRINSQHNTFNTS